MIFLWILLALVALIVAILYLNVHIIFYYRESVRVTIRVLFVRLDALKLFRRFTDEKNPAAEEKPAEVKAEKKGTKKRSGDFLGFVEFLTRIARIIGLAIKEHFSKMKVHLKDLHIYVATDDAAKTALTSGGAIQAGNFLIALLQRFCRFQADSKNLVIAPDFTSEKSRFSIHLDLSFKPIHLIGVLLRAYFRLLEGKDNSYERNPVETGH